MLEIKEEFCESTAWSAQFGASFKWDGSDWEPFSYLYIYITFQEKLYFLFTFDSLWIWYRNRWDKMSGVFTQVVHIFQIKFEGGMSPIQRGRMEGITEGEGWQASPFHGGFCNALISREVLFWKCCKGRDVTFASEDGIISRVCSLAEVPSIICTISQLPITPYHF